MIKIIAVCGLGMGSSLMLRMTAESAMKSLGVDCEVEHWDMGTVKGRKADIILMSEHLRDGFEDDDSNTIYVKNIIDVEEVKAKLKEYLKNKSL